MTHQELGTLLRKARLAKKWHFYDLQHRTKINVAFIKAMEQGQFDFLPEPYARAFIRAYAKEVDLDPQEVIEQFETSHRQVQPIAIAPQGAGKGEKKEIEDKNFDEIAQTPEEPTFTQPKLSEAEIHSGAEKTPTEESVDATQQVPVEPTEEAPRHSFRQYRTVIFLSALFGFALVIIVAMYLKYGRYYFSARRQPVQRISIFEAANELQARQQADSSRVPPEVTKASLRVVAQKLTWMQLIKDEVDTLEFLFQPGNEKKFEAQHSLRLKLGRADGLILWVNDDSIGVLGPAGKIVNPLLITPAGIVEKKLRRPLPIRAPEFSAPESTQTTLP